MCNGEEQKSWKHTSQSACYQLLCPKTAKDKENNKSFFKDSDYKGFFKLRQYFLHCPNCMLNEFLSTSM